MQTFARKILTKESDDKFTLQKLWENERNCLEGFCAIIESRDVNNCASWINLFLFFFNTQSFLMSATKSVTFT